MMLLPEASSAVSPAKAPSIASLQLITCGDRGAHDLSYKVGLCMSSQVLQSRFCCLSKQDPLPVTEAASQQGTRTSGAAPLNRKASGKLTGRPVRLRSSCSIATVDNLSSSSLEHDAQWTSIAAV
jgi:hypothetical protein